MMKSNSPDSMWHSRTIGQPLHLLLELLQIGIGLAVHSDEHEARHLEPSIFGVEIGVITFI